MSGAKAWLSEQEFRSSRRLLARGERRTGPHVALAAPAGQLARALRAFDAPLRARVVTELQREYGNACLQRLVTRASAPVLQRDPVTAEKPAPAASPFGVNYASAERRNRNYATRLGWASRLADVRPDWHSLWTTGNVNGFADAVAGFQSAEKFKVVDGVLGPKTWTACDRSAR